MMVETRVDTITVHATPENAEQRICYWRRRDYTYRQSEMKLCLCHMIDCIPKPITVLCYAKPFSRYAFKINNVMLCRRYKKPVTMPSC